jgi:putative transcriptional regulator
VDALAPGLLIAMPQLGDPNFHRGVVLMLEHGEGGSMGLVVNRAAPLTLQDVSAGQVLEVAPARLQEAVFVGGPIEPQRGFVLHDAVGVDEAHEVLPGLFLSVTMQSLGPLLSGGEHHLRFCLGYAGWGPRQLEDEISKGAWLFTEASAGAVFEVAPEQLWESTLRGMGVEPAMLSTSKGVN